MIQQLVILGATGDLTARYLLPALGALRTSGHLDERFGLTAVGREDWTADAYRAWAAEQLDRHAPELSGEEIAERWRTHTPPTLSNQTPWQELFRAHTGQMDTGACLDLAVAYRDVVHTKGLPRDSH
ncbi:hypothetical protein KZZ52_37370 [Dactylosporangium sp. AC04546]|uniref:hypothetical protein n=1 Tax=Dactylosporangium sp. AC04546 TaxID=2862460 RepID=UPI001EDE3B1E|nr:hypothetical protein [Dactylosporangium sp. AC04546]WVK79635.1 hypothetical protein KZZ52_37370 [Dactylosporangium sp. AC04546]